MRLRLWARQAPNAIKSSLAGRVEGVVRVPKITGYGSDNNEKPLADDRV